MKTKLIKFLLGLLGQRIGHRSYGRLLTPPSILIERAESLDESAAYEMEDAANLRQRAHDCIARAEVNQSEAAALRVAAAKLQQAE